MEEVLPADKAVLKVTVVEKVASVETSHICRIGQGSWNNWRDPRKIIGAKFPGSDNQVSL